MNKPPLFVSTGTRDQEVANFLNNLFVQAVRWKVSDIHIEDYEDGVRIRLRHNGLLVEQYKNLDKHFGRELGSKIRARAKLPLSDRETPLDGRIILHIEGRYVDVRVSIVPTSHGESIVCRLLDQQNAGMPFEAIEMTSEVRAAIRRAMERPDGMLLASGPTGSGKTTTLYSVLHELNEPTKKIITIEDPVEYRLPYACQIPVSVNTSFPRAIRAVLRQDPDIILVGEIRDSETAKVSIQAAMTGHLVLSSIHANDAPTTITRLMDLMEDAEGRKADPYLLELTLSGIIAQRLVRVLCPKCKQPGPPENGEALWLKRIGYDPQQMTVYYPVGCEECHNIGFVGQTPIIEYLEITPEIRRTIKTRNRENLQKVALKQPQYQPLIHGAISKAISGITSLKEIRRVIRDAEI
ncbi:Type II secretory pathway ATPase GspE/PulE or T4P pilus assembly pathway ATPase PilB [Desulfacinum hydrothermale DSM 13146]|uniref:Type II secretory pathway ATPase GspE/PulE or T4P pilus assembly pathway ATPase PilB n=1 Tax=Desulfacinum hydrothermale DSM 13146 TaxID=1121390 RepID=A0A1W1XX16_9BACT|nr:GspE/PulE family protein [Desulfacinum hydrothermale]SMC28483.1 Type II secretory pathway ATPase GspE/PulE or T4P pilus assembly pathway ATPase PilB [Desulfacinum hydrothermale DSM 13146]